MSGPFLSVKICSSLDFEIRESYACSTLRLLNHEMSKLHFEKLKYRNLEIVKPSDLEFSCLLLLSLSMSVHTASGVTLDEDM